jgi:hypothetical protein
LDGASPSFFGRFFALGKFVLNKTNSPKNKVLATFLGDFWRLLATFGDFWRLFTDFLATFGDFLATFWRLLATFWRLFGDFLATFWRLFGDFLATFWRLLKQNHLVTLLQNVSAGKLMFPKAAVSKLTLQNFFNDPLMAK